MNQQQIKEILKQHLLENAGNRLTRHNILGLVEMIALDIQKIELESSSKTEE